MLKEIDGKLRFVAASADPARSPFAPPLEQDERTGGFELWLHPELCVGVVIGNVDTQTSVFAEDD